MTLKNIPIESGLHGKKEKRSGLVGGKKTSGVGNVGKQPTGYGNVPIKTVHFVALGKSGRKRSR